MHRILAQCFPNNEVRLVFASLPALRPIKDGQDDDDFSSEKGECLNQVEKNGTLSLSSNSKTSDLTTGYGLLSEKPTVFGLNAKRILIRSGAALEKSICDPSECLFLTATLPGSTSESFRAIAEWSGYIVNSLKAWIANYVRAKLDFYCWEYQRRGALHLHYCVAVQDEKARSHIQKGFHDWWVQILRRLNDKSGVDLFRKNDRFTHLNDTSKVRAVAEICRKSPARYLAKYLSKSAKGLKGRARFFTPSRWWGTSRPLKKILESLTTTIGIIEGGYFSCIKKMQELKAVFESCEGRYHDIPHKYGVGNTLLIYPSSDSDREHLLEEIQAMTTLSKIELAADRLKPSVVLREDKIRLLKWSFYWMNELASCENGMKESLREFNQFLYTVIPSESDDPLMLIYEWRNRLWNLNDCIGYSWCGRNREDRLMIERSLVDLEMSIDKICKSGWE